MSDNTGDLVSKIVEANTLESAGKSEQAIALYQEILKLDRGGNYGDVAQQALNNLQQEQIAADVAGIEEIPMQQSNWWSKLSIKSKTSLLLTGVALASSICIGTVAYYIANRTIARQVNRAELQESRNITKEIGLLIRQSYGDIKTIANIGVLANPQLRANTNSLLKQATLRRYVSAYGVYSSITALDLTGNPIAHSSRETINNQQDRQYFQETLKFDLPRISQPIVTENSNTPEILFSAPIKDTQTAKTIGVVVARMPVAVIADLIDSSNSYQTVYLSDNQGQIFWSSAESADRDDSSSFDLDRQIAAKLNRRRELVRSYKPSAIKDRELILTGEAQIGYLSTFLDLDARLIQDLPYLGWSTILAVDKSYIFAAQRQLLQVFIIGTALAGLAVVAIAQLIADRATRPIVEAAEAVDKMGQGDLSIKLAVNGEDELADLNRNINRMAGQIEDLLFTQEAETKKQRQEKELLQQGVMSLLLDVEGAQKGDLTVKAQMTDGAVGSIADAFNATINKLRTLLQEVQSVSSQVGQLSLAGENSVRQLSESALGQTVEIEEALGNIDRINQSIETVANYAQEAARIAREGSIQAKEGDLAMDATVDSIEKIRHTVANTAKKVKQLAESSQEIAQIVEIISGISEKTNLLAFNASVEAARAGEHGEGFRIVAEEVRRLADRITESTKDIQQLVTAIQQDTSSVLEGMETSTSEVVNGSELVRLTKANLRSLADTSRQIDEYLNYISTNTIDQTNTSRQVNQKIGGIATLAKTNSTEAQSVVQSLRTLVAEADNLQSSIAQFKLEP